MQASDLELIDKTNVILGVGAAAVGGAVWGLPGLAASGTGAALAVLNFWAIRRLAGRALERVARGTSARQAVLLVAALTGKMALLFGLVWAALSLVGLRVVPFALGFSVLVVSLLLTGLFLGLSDSRAEV